MLTGGRLQLQRLLGWQERDERFIYTIRSGFVSRVSIVVECATKFWRRYSAVVLPVRVVIIAWS